MTARRPRLGFTLIELMVAVAIIGVVAAFAVPAYLDYVVRARVSEGIEFVAPYKVKLAEYISDHGVVPPGDEDWYVQGGQVVVARVHWSISRYAIEVWFGPKAGTQLNGTILWLVPAPTASTVRWTCRGHTGEGGAAWRIDPRYLPTSCR